MSPYCGRMSRFSRAADYNLQGIPLFQKDKTEQGDSYIQRYREMIGNTCKMSWMEFQKWQRWDEFPERIDNPPMTVDVSFFFEGNEYHITESHEQYHLYTSNWDSVHANFLLLLTSPVALFRKRSFKDIIHELDFDC